MKVSRELWEQVEPLLTAALDLDPMARPEWLRGIDASRPDIAPVLRRMVETHERASRSGELETGRRLALIETRASAHAAGEAIGPFELISILGRGGMGEVWLARQADGRVERNVALKLPSTHQPDGTWRERFRRERDILARLEHPHIARLYDAGVTAAGQPWLAMEFVEGLTLTQHVASRTLSMPERLALFRQVLSAVAHAHRHLVVHRDLKPPNILVDASGEVKLLDFGIAKLVAGDEDEATQADLTRIGGRVLTIRYAAPEQVSGGTITTSTDIYSLGVILHELVTGMAPYRAVREGRALTDANLLEEQTTLPSRLPIPRELARLVSGDLDAIVLKAMRRDPAERYASVERFDEDIRAHLEGRPVKARAGTWRYLAGRFVTRHKLPMAAAAAVLVTLIGGLVMADRERRVAVAEKARAERHFASVRKLANTFIFDVHAEIEKLEGSLKAREMLVKTSLDYLDALAAEAGRDPALTFEIASAYRNIGNIYGEPGAANRGDPRAAIVHFEKARKLFQELEVARPDDPEMLREHRRLRFALARSYFEASDARWKAEILENARLARRLAALPKATIQDRAQVPIALAEEASLTTIREGRTPATDALMAESLAMHGRLLKEAPEDFFLKDLSGRLELRAAKILGNSSPTPRDLELAMAHAERALVSAREGRRARPNSTPELNAELECLGLLGKMQEMAGQYGKADATIAEAVALSATIQSREPANVNVAIDRVTVLVNSAEIALRLGEPERAIRMSRQALEVAARMPVQTRDTRFVGLIVANAKARLGIGLLAVAESKGTDRNRRMPMLLEAKALLDEVQVFVDDFLARKLGQIEAEDLETLSAARKGVAQAIAGTKA